MTAAAAMVRGRTDLVPEVALVLGSGLSALAGAVRDPVAFDYGELAGFHVSAVAGHAGRLVLGTLAGRPVAVLQGRAHLYEGVPDEAIRAPLDTVAALGATRILITNAVGSLRAEVAPGALVAATDHINLQGRNPLGGGPRFLSLRELYDPELRAGLHAAARRAGVVLHDGVYLATLGPTFETAAEIRAFRLLGADTVGMSLVPEAIAARHAGLRVAAVSAVTNLAEGMGGDELSHEQTLREGERASADLATLVTAWLEDGS